MATVTWKGEGEEGPKELRWAGRTFKVGESVEIDNKDMLKKASSNPNFEVSGYTEEEEERGVTQPYYPEPGKPVTAAAPPKAPTPVKPIPKV